MKYLCEYDPPARPIYIREVQPNGTVILHEMQLKEFGPIQNFGIQVGRNKEGNHFFLVEFESATTKQRAITSFPILFGDCSTPMRDDIGLTDRTLVNRNKPQAVGSSSFCQKKFKIIGQKVPHILSDDPGLENDLEEVVKEPLNFSEEQFNKALQDAEESKKELSKLQETHEAKAVLEEDLSLVESLVELTIQKSVESVFLEGAVNKIKETVAECKRLKEQLDQ